MKGPGRVLGGPKKPQKRSRRGSSSKTAVKAPRGPKMGPNQFQGAQGGQKDRTRSNWCINPIAHGGGRFFPSYGIYCKCSKTDEIFLSSFMTFQVCLFKVQNTKIRPLPLAPHRVESMGLKLRILSENRNYEFTLSSRRFA